MKKTKIILFSLFFFLLSSVVSPVHASLFDSTFESFRSLVTPIFATVPSTVNIDSSMTLVEDKNNNGIVDGGDTIKISYHLLNPTNQNYSFLTIETHLNRDILNFIHNVQGTFSLTDTGKTISIPNFSLPANQSRDISFEARLNYSEGEEFTLSTTPQIITQEHNTLSGASTKKISIKPWFPKGFSSMIQHKPK